MGRRSLLLLGATVLAAVVGTGYLTLVRDRAPEVVYRSQVAAVELPYDAPAYIAGTRGGMIVRADDNADVLDAVGGAWLPDGEAGRVLVELPRGRVQVFDPATGESGATMRMPLPSRSVSQVTETNGVRSLTAYDLELEELWSVDLPPTDDEAALENEAFRSYYGATPTIDGVTFVRWDDDGEFYEDGDYGILRIAEEGADLANVLVNVPIVAFHLSADGTSLLAVAQRSGEPCGGCVVSQNIVEIDPATGGVARNYGTPEDYTKLWRAAAVDKVGQRVAVRYTSTRFVGRQGAFPQTVQQGTWVYDGAGWSMVPGSRDELTWWQGPDDRVVARPQERGNRSGDRFDLFWLHGDEETALPGEVTSSGGPRPVTGSVAGQLLPPLGD